MMEKQQATNKAMNNIHIAEGSNSTKKQVISPRKAVEALYSTDI